jgi:hypothetical protein
MGLHQIKKFLKEVTSIKRQLIEWEKVFASYLRDKRLISRISKELKKLNS